ncbi:acyl carrier protein phosphodiesterase [Spiroplasma kunkelii CR2-3x]|uniref:FMN dependent NADH:quinone oxidoreductase n=1 Tax=Spiroplasma kunkelii CR2-3x TaxID=273035 RepID=A0A0K2JHE8_SPIKU|nr:FMN-dependent NADH-azoreductase [Spiroplasma kunkelii]ALA97842.1 acyl carrier protein phosphodiesterase [Spiroplasma kunkelii CR2-3x]
MANKVLVIYGTVSPNEKSYSKALAARFLKYYQAANANDEIILLDLNETPMALKTLTRDNFGTYFNAEDTDVYINQLKEVQKVIVVCPMNNFNVSGLMKNYLDHVLVADKTFSYKYAKKGDAIGLLTNLKVQILTTQGAPFGWYPWGNHTEYLKGTWEFVGATVNKPILVAGTKVAPTNVLSPDELIDQYDEEIQKVVKTF